MKNFFQKVKSRVIYFPLLFYPVVFVYAKFLFGRDFKIFFPTKNVTEGSTHFIFILESKEDGQKYIAKFRNVFGDMYFKHHTGVTRLPNEEYLKLMKQVTEDEYVKEIIPEIIFYKNRILWEFLEGAIELNSPESPLVIEKRKEVRQKINKAVEHLLEKGIIYGKVKGKHILVKENRAVLIDWDTARYTQ